MENHCICCGAEIPEGRQVCPACEALEVCQKATPIPLCRRTLVIIAEILQSVLSLIGGYVVAMWAIFMVNGRDITIDLPTCIAAMAVSLAVNLTAGVIQSRREEGRRGFVSDDYENL